MILKKASNKAIKYACLNFHYAKSIPVNVFGYSVFNNNKEWCGVVLYGTGANNNLAANYKLNQGNVIELVRVALNGKQESTSKALSISMRLIKKDIPLAKLLISYADKDQEHKGIIYQATNWFYVGTSMKDKKDSSWIINGKRYHGRVISDWVKKKGGLNGLTRKEFLKKYYDKNAIEFITKGKIKYIYPIDKKLINMCKEMKKPYLKDMAKESDKVESNANSKLGA